MAIYDPVARTTIYKKRRDPIAVIAALAVLGLGLLAFLT